MMKRKSLIIIAVIVIMNCFVTGVFAAAAQTGALNSTNVVESFFAKPANYDDVAKKYDPYYGKLINQGPFDAKTQMAMYFGAYGFAAAYAGTAGDPQRQAYFDYLNSQGFSLTKNDDLGIKAKGLQYVYGKAAVSDQGLKTNVYLVSFRGTTGPALIGPEWILDDYDIIPTTFLKTTNRVHRGMYTYVLPAIAQDFALNQLIRTAVSDGNGILIVSGHSLGGGAAKLFAAYVLQNFNINPAKLYVITAGEPAPGEADFNNSYEKYFVNYHPFFQEGDIVPYSTVDTTAKLYNHMWDKVTKIAPKVLSPAAAHNCDSYFNNIVNNYAAGFKARFNGK